MNSPDQRSDAPRAPTGVPSLHFSGNPERIKAARNYLAACAAELRRRFESGEAVENLVRARAVSIDQLLRQVWQEAMADNSGAALIAVGGYGRGELHPASDIDLLVLLADQTGDFLNTSIGALVTLLWDIGLEVGHSVRSLADCVSEAGKDVTVATNLMESRLIAGQSQLFGALRQATGPDRIWPSRAFFEAKWNEQQQRHRKFDDAYSNLEPNIKQGPGGLRDIQMIGWVAKRHFGGETLHDLVARGFLTDAEYQSLIEGQSFLWRVRFALHLLSNRHEERLLFDYQKTLADQFGYADQPHNLAVEQFMQRYYRTILEMGRLSEMLLQLFQEAILLQDRLDTPIPINRRFQSRNGFLEVTGQDVFRRTPFALLELFLLLQNHPNLKGVRASTIRLIRNQRGLIDEAFRNNLTTRSLFMEIIRQPCGITHELRRMNRYGILAAYLPVFSHIVGRMQYDLFHVYTVDEHSLFVVRNLRRFAVPEYYDEFPLCSRISQRLPKPELLYLAGLFHDIAKGRGGDHSILGAVDARDFCQKHDLSAYDTNLVAWLVEKHLVMSMTAQRKDISDPEVIQAFASEVGDPTRLDYLYLLTVADIRATNPQRWNSWKDALLKELYLATRRALERGLDNPERQDQIIRDRQQEARKTLEDSGSGHLPVVKLWEKLGNTYFQQHTSEEIAWHSRLIATSTPEQMPLIALHRNTGRGGSEVLLYCPDRDGLFATTATLLGQIGLSVVSARLQTTNHGYALNSYLVLEENGELVEDLRREQEIIEVLRHGLLHPEEIEHRVLRHVPRRLRQFHIEPSISFSEDLHQQRTIVRLVAGDRPGLLAEVGHAFNECGVIVHHANISTIGAEVEDVFFVTDREQQPLRDVEQRDCLEQAITQRLSEQPA